VIARRLIRLLIVAQRPLTWVWPAPLRRFARDEREAVLEELLAATHAAHGWPATLGCWGGELFDALAIGVRLARPTPLIAAAATAGVLVATLRLTASPGTASPEEAFIQGSDPAGSFSLLFRDGVLAEATVDGTAAPPSRLWQRGDSAWVLSPSGHRALAVQYLPPATIRWAARPARRP